MSAPSPEDVRWSADAIALFRQYTDARAQHRPLECADGEVCWVAQGPPGMSSQQRCLGCGGLPKQPLGTRKRIR